MIPFHRVLIATAVVFCGGFALWALAQYLAGHETGMLALCLTFVLLTGALIYYLLHLKRFLGR